MLAVVALVPLVLAAPQDPLTVELTPKQGAPVIAEWDVAEIGVDTGFGRALIDADKLEQITFGEPDLVLAAGEELRGDVSFTLLAVEVDGRPRAFRTSELLTLVVAGAGGMTGNVSFAGEWMSSVGPMQLTQDGAKVTGTFGWGGSGTIAGQVRGGKLAFDHEQGRTSGRGTFEFVGSAGEVLFGSKGEKGFWGAYRKAPRRAAVKPGQVTSGQTDVGLRYHVHWPAGHVEGRPLPAICILHGSNMNSRAYVDTIVTAWPELAADYLVVGLDGERMSRASKAGNAGKVSGTELRFNYSYVNFGGPNVGPEWARKQSPALVAAALAQLGEEFHVERWFLGGHSQGGFLTYCLVMFYPELLAGAFPMSCNLLVQCEPDNFDPGRRAAQHEVAIAMIHGQRDAVVKYSAGEYCEARIMDSGFPFARLFAPPKVGHQFALLPVDEAVRWLDGVSSPAPAALVDFAAARADDAAWRDVGALLARLQRREVPAELADRVEALRGRLAMAAGGPATELTARIAADHDGRGRWIEAFLTFRREFGTAPAAAPVLAEYGRLRAAQKDAGDRLFQRSRRAGQKSDRLVIYEQIAKECWATKWYEAVKLWSR